MITLKFDNTLPFEDIKVPIMSEGPENDPSGNDNYPRQTKIFGVMIPIIQINKYVVFPNDVVSMNLSIENHVPHISCVVRDSMSMLRALDSPDNDNNLQLQIIPPFDNAYKKIRLNFYITRSIIDNGMVTLDGIYNIDKLWDCVMKSYGLTTTYRVFEQIAHDLHLGFASNVSDTNDERYIYNSNLNNVDFMKHEEMFAGNTESLGGMVFEWWIDYWNNLNLVDVLQEYNAIYTLPKIWSPQLKWKDPESPEEDDPEPVQIEPEITNASVNARTPLFTSSYDSVNITPPYTDINSEIFSMMDMDRYSTLVQDGDVKDHIFMKYSYDGELFGEYDYLTQRRCHNVFLAKMRSQMLRTSVKDAVFSLPKGFKLNFIWFEYQTNLTGLLNDHEINTNIPTPPIKKNGDDNDDNTPTLNKQITGQYYINNMDIQYYAHQWNTVFELARPAAGIEKYIFGNEQGK